MNRSVNSGLNVGIALLGLGILLAVGGLMGRNWMQKATLQYANQVSNERETIQERLIGDGMVTLMARMQEIGPIWVVNATEISTGLEFEFQPPLDIEIDSFLSDFEERFRREMPDIQHVVEVSLNVAGPAPDYVHKKLRSWLIGSPDLSSEEIKNPVTYRIGQRYGSQRYSKSENLWLSIPGSGEPPFLFDREESRDVAGAISSHFPDNFRMNFSEGGYLLDCYMNIRIYDELADSNRFLQASRTILDRFSKLGFLLLFIGPALGVVLDARRRRLPSALWGLFVLPTSALGMLIYSLVNRDAGPGCPECGERISARFVVCPYCQTELKGTCPTCGQIVGLGWHYCPSCSTQL